MIGNDQIRFCDHCNLQVHNISAMSRADAMRLVERSQGRLCVRYYRDGAGQLLTAKALPRQTAPPALYQLGRRVSRLAAGAFGATLSLSSAVAQSPIAQNQPASSQGISPVDNLNSSIVGRITDPNGAVIPGASIAITSDELHLALYTSTNYEGEFRFDGLAAEVYNVRIEAPGFSPLETGGLYLQANGEMRVDRGLSPAGPIEELNVASQLERSVTVGVVAMVAPSDPFIKAVQEDNLEEATALIAGRDVNLRDPSSHTTALEYAVENGNRELVQLLLAAGANVNLTNDGGSTPLMMLGGDATADLVWDLINSGAEVNHKDNYGNTPLLTAAARNNSEVLKTLLDAGANVAARNQDGHTPLMLAAAEGLINNVRALVLAGAELTTRDANGKDALSHAIENDHSAVMRYLKSQGAVAAAAQLEKEN